MSQTINSLNSELAMQVWYGSWQLSIRFNYMKLAFLGKKEEQMDSMKILFCLWHLFLFILNLHELSELKILTYEWIPFVYLNILESMCLKHSAKLHVFNCLFMYLSFWINLQGLNGQILSMQV